MGPPVPASSGSIASKTQQKGQSSSQAQLPLANGVVSDTQAPGGATVNRKKQKRRQKQAARQAAAQEEQSFDTEYDLHNPGLDRGSELPMPQSFAGSPHRAGHHYMDPYDDPADAHYPPTQDQYGYSDEDAPYSYESASRALNNLDLSSGLPSSPPKKKKKGKRVQNGLPYDHLQAHGARSNYPSNLSHVPPPPPPPPPISDAALRTVQRSMNKDPIWDTSTQEERARIKDFWLTISEKERKGLVKIEKEAVLRKMKEQQKHSCSCTVCGRKRTAIEEELEVLYDAYYSELERFANRGDQPSANRQLPSSNVPKYLHRSTGSGGRQSRIKELTEAEAKLYQDEAEGLSDDEDAGDIDFSGEETDEVHQMRHAHAQAQPTPPDFFAFGQSLTVKGGILTVADDLLKNDGQKFIDMMEQLAERRMQREEQAINPLRNLHPQQVPPPHSHVGHNHLPPEEDEEDFDEEEDDDAYDSQEDDFDEEEDEMDTMTEEQRMEEGRRMFQIFAARMFEQRVLTAYREKVAHERQQKLIEELEAETIADSQRDAKKARDAEKKKAKKQQQKQAKAEEKARKDEQKAAEEAAIKEAEAKKLEEQRLKREEQRKRKEAERKALEDERQKKEAEKQRRQQEERNRQQEAERKLREQKAEEKRRREEARKQEREDRDAKERAAREQKIKEAPSKDKASKSKTGADGQSSKRDPEQPAVHTSGPVTEAGKRPSVSAVVALPPALKTQKSYTTQPSPGAKVVTPSVPKAPTPVKSQASSGVNVAKPTQVPDTGRPPMPTTPPKTVASNNAPPLHANASQTSNRRPSFSQAPLASPHGIAPPPGMNHAPQHGSFPGVPSGMINGFPGSQAPPIPGMHAPVSFQRQMPAYGHDLHGVNQRPYMPPSMTGVAPPGIAAQGMRSPGPAMRNEIASAFPSSTRTSAGLSGTAPTPTSAKQIHSRQPSTSHDTGHRDAQPHTTQPIARPAPIKRPASAKPNEALHSLDTNDGDDLDKHLGSKALLDDADDPLDAPPENKRPSVGAPGSATTPGSIGGGILGSPFPNFPSSHGAGVPDSWRMPGQSGFSQTPGGPPTPGWGVPQHQIHNVPSSASGWGGHNGHNIGPTHTRSGHQMQHHQPRPITVRKLACQACRRLSMQKANGMNDGYHDINEVLRQIDSMRAMPDPQVQLAELHNILDTEGDAHNGGGSFSISQKVPNRLLVRWENDGHMASVGGIPSGLGQIGSPISPNGIPSMAGRGL